MSSFVLWDIDGNKIEEVLPAEEKVNLVGPGIEPSKAALPGSLELETVLESLHRATNAYTRELYEIGRNNFIVFDATLSDGTHYIVRVARLKGSSSSEELPALRDKVQREYAMLQWMQSIALLPVPRVHLCERNAASPFMITDKCKGGRVTELFGTLSESAKVHSLRSYAQIAIAMFRAPCPQEIGSISLFSASSDYPSRAHEVAIGPIIPFYFADAVSQPFQTVTDYFQWLATCRKRRATFPAEVEPILNQLLILLSKELEHQDEDLLRCIPHQNDPSSHNFLIDDSGNITGMIDWEFHMVSPAYLVAEYPSWLLYDGPSDPTFITVGQFSHFWCASRSEAELLRQKYDEIVKELDLDYFRALKSGALSRMAVNWLTSDADSECQQIQRWLHSIE